MKPFVLAWQSIVTAWPTMNTFQHILWIVFFPLLYTMTITAVVLYKPKDVK